MADFETLTDALEYAAQGITGYNFYDSRGNLSYVLTYRELREKARHTALCLSGMGLQRGERAAIIADNSPEFIILFFACRYAGIIPFALPVPVNLGSHDVYIKQLRGVMEVSEAPVAISNKDFIGFLEKATEALPAVRWIGTLHQLNELPESDTSIEKNRPGETAYLQFTSGSTRFPQGVVITEQAVMSNLKGIVRHGLRMYPEDRCASWLPFYHDMGLIGLVLSPLVSQLSVDFLRTRDFAIRPIQWLKIISRNRCTIAFSPPFGYELCTLRVRGADLDGIDLSCWRAAGVGAEMIRPEILHTFAEKFSPVGFTGKAFLPCYGLAEASLAVSFAGVNEGISIFKVDSESMINRGVIVQAQATGRMNSEFVNCGRPLPGIEVSIMDNQDRELPELRVGSVLIKGPSLMTGYLNDPETTRRTLKPDGWLDTGDFGFMCEGNLYLTGRRNDIIIINGRNIRAQDIEEIAEQQTEIRARESSAFSIEDGQGQTTVVLVVECQISSMEKLQSLTNRLQSQVYSAFGVHCIVELVPPHTLPRTSSGKLSRSAAREGYKQRTGLTDYQLASSDTK